jgi:hypothetical protein
MANIGAAVIQLRSQLRTRFDGGDAQHALKSTDLLIQAGGFGLIVLDMADTTDAMARRIPLASWFRLRHAAERTGAALVAVERQINARSCSTLQIEMRLKKPLWIGKLLRGLMAQAASQKRFPTRTTDPSACALNRSQVMDFLAVR